MATIKNIIFDLGGVLLDIDYHKTAKAFTDLGVQQFDDLYSQVNANDLFEALETGTISEDDFYKSLHSYCQPATTRFQMQSAWNAILLNFRVESLSVLEELKKKFSRLKELILKKLFSVMKTKVILKKLKPIIWKV